MQVLKEHYDNLIWALNELSNIRAIEAIAHYNPTMINRLANDDFFISTMESLMVYDCKVDIEGHAQYFFCKPADTAIYYISCLFDKAEATVDKVIFRLTTEQ